MSDNDQLTQSNLCTYRLRFTPVLVLLSLLTCVSITICPTAAYADAPEFVMADRQQSQASVVISPDADDRVQRVASQLADMLGRMAGTTFEVKQGNGSEGIVVGLPSHFDSLPTAISPDFAPQDPRQLEHYLLQSTHNGVYLLGASETAVENAVWDFLYRIGFRQFFPGEHWEIVPRHTRLAMAIKDYEKPDAITRRIWAGHGALPFNNWLIRNRARQGLNIIHSHAYRSIVSKNKEIFKAHPEYMGLVNGKRTSSKICISNPGARQVAVDYAMAHFQANPESISISMEPSDGGGWCECEPCAQIGTPSDRMIFLCNQVAEAINAKYTNKYVGTLAYFQHTLPSKYDVHPNVAMFMAMGLRTGGLTTEELITGWRAKGIEIMGLTYNVGGPYMLRNLPRISKEIKKWHHLGINRFVIDVEGSWGFNGLGNYLLSRVLWDVDESDQFDALLDDFYERAFQRAEQPMRDYFNLIYINREDQFSWPIIDSTLARMYQALDQALKAESDPAVRARISDFVIYTHVLELNYLYNQATSKVQRDAISTRQMKFIHRTRQRRMVHSSRRFSRPYFYKLSGYSAVPMHRLPIGKSPWKSKLSFGEQEMMDIVKAGVENYKVHFQEITPVVFSEDLVPAKEALKLPDVRNPHFGRGDHYVARKFYTWIDESGEIAMKVHGGKPSGGRVTVSLYTDKEAISGPVDTDQSTGPNETQRIVLKSPHKGLHWVQIESGGSHAKVVLENPKQHRTYVAAPGSPNWAFPSWVMFFYVPKGTQFIGGYAETNRGALVDSSGRVQFKNGILRGPNGMPMTNTLPNGKKWDGGYFKVPVPPGEDGKIWSLGSYKRLVSRRWYLLTVPPYVAQTVDQLMLPREVVEKDAR